jgi:hypothetical protein
MPTQHLMCTAWLEYSVATWDLVSEERVGTIFGVDPDDVSNVSSRSHNIYVQQFRLQCAKPADSLLILKPWILHIMPTFLFVL